MRTNDFDYLMVVTFMDRPGVDEREAEYRRENRRAAERQSRRQAARQALWTSIAARVRHLFTGTDRAAVA